MFYLWICQRARLQKKREHKKYNIKKISLLKASDWGYLRQPIFLHDSCLNHLINVSCLQTEYVIRITFVLDNSSAGKMFPRCPKLYKIAPLQDSKSVISYSTVGFYRKLVKSLSCQSWDIAEWQTRKPHNAAR